jgi:hypothetical protein
MCLRLIGIHENLIKALCCWPLMFIYLVLKRILRNVISQTTVPFKRAISLPMTRILL